MKISRVSDAKIGPFIISEAFPKSPISPHLKLKEMAMRKGTMSLVNINITNHGNSIEQTHCDSHNTSMAEEVALPCP